MASSTWNYSTSSTIYSAFTSFGPSCSCARFADAGFKKTGREARFSLVARFCDWHQCGWVREKDWTDYCVEKLDTMGEKK